MSSCQQGTQAEHTELFCTATSSRSVEWCKAVSRTVYHVTRMYTCLLKCVMVFMCRDLTLETFLNSTTIRQIKSFNKTVEPFIKMCLLD